MIRFGLMILAWGIVLMNFAAIESGVLTIDWILAILGGIMIGVGSGMIDIGMKSLKR